MEGRGVKGHESISAYVHTVLPNCPSVSLNRWGRVAGGTSLLLPVSLQIETYQLWMDSVAVCTHMRTSGVGECSRSMAVPSFTISGVSPVPKRFRRDRRCRRRGFAPNRSVCALLQTGCTTPGREEEGANFLLQSYLEPFAVVNSCTLALFSNNLKSKLPVGFSRP